MKRYLKDILLAIAMSQVSIAKIYPGAEIFNLPIISAGIFECSELFKNWACVRTCKLAADVKHRKLNRQNNLTEKESNYLCKTQR